MRLRIIDRDHLLAVLSREEAESLGMFEAGGGPFRFNSFRSRLAAAKILSSACSRGFVCHGRRITLRVLPSPQEHILLLFCLEAPRRRRFRIKYGTTPTVFRLPDAGTLLDLLERLQNAPVAAGTAFSVYRLGPAYAVVCAPPLSARRGLCALLGDYGSCLGRGAALAAFAEEHGELLLRLPPGQKGANNK